MEIRYSRKEFLSTSFNIVCSLKSPRSPRLLHRRVHLNDLPDYLISGASKQLILDRTRSPSVSSASQYDDHSGFLAIEQDETPRSYTAVPHKRYFDDELTHSNKRHVLTERVIPVEHQRVTVVREEKPTVRRWRVCSDWLFFDFSFQQNHHLNV